MTPRTRHRLPLLVAAAAALATSCARLPIGGSRLALVEKGNAPCPVVVRPDAAAEERKAAHELAAYLGRISGADFALAVASNAPPAPVVLVGAGWEELPPDLGEEGYVIRADGERLLIAGTHPRGTEYGVFGFLEDVLGCRWWSHSEETIPERATIRLRALDITERPAFSIHNPYNKEAQNPKNSFALKRRAQSLERFDGGHSLCPYLKPYAEQFPHFLPMDKAGERKFNNLHMCYSAPEMPEKLAEALEKRLAANGGDLEHVIYFAGMGDWYGGMCLCPACKAVYEEELWTDPDGRKKPGYTGPLLRMFNRTAEILDAKHPGIRIGTFAYMSLEAPPANTVPRDNVVLWMPHLRHCIVHGVEECEKNKSFVRNLERWLELAPGNVYIWDYGISFANFLYPFPNTRSIADNIRTYHRLGVGGVSVQGNYVSTGGDMAVLRNYVWGRLLWDPTRRTDVLLDEFCRGYYGPAAKAMLAYVDTLEDSVRVPEQVHLDEFEKDIRGKYLSDEVLERLDAHIERAMSMAGEREPYARRVREARVSPEALRLWKPGPIEEQGDRLVRSDLGDTWQRALDLVKYCRNASPREWGSGRAYRMGFLTYHGGPMVVLERGPLTVKIAPTLNGRIRRILYGGKDLLHVPDHAQDENANSSGAYEQLSTGSRIYEIEGAATPTSAALRAELGVANWGSSTKQTASKTVTLTDEGALRVEGQAVRTQAGAKTIGCRSVTEYAAGRDMSQVAVRIQALEGPWQDIKIIAGKPDPEKMEPNAAGATALRVKLGAQGVTVEDRYLAPAAKGGYVWYDVKRGVLVTEINTATVDVPPEDGAQYLLREVTVAPLER